MKPTIRFASTVSLIALLAAPSAALAAANVDAPADPGVTAAEQAGVDTNRGMTGETDMPVADAAETENTIGVGRGQEEPTTAGSPPNRFNDVLVAADSALAEGRALPVTSSDGQMLGTLSGPIAEAGEALVMTMQLDPSIGAGSGMAELTTSATLDAEGRIVIPMNAADFSSAAGGQSSGATMMNESQMAGGEQRSFNIDMPDDARGQPIPN